MSNQWINRGDHLGASLRIVAGRVELGWGYDWHSLVPFRDDWFWDGRPDDLTALN